MVVSSVPRGGGAVPTDANSEGQEPEVIGGPILVILQVLRSRDGRDIYYHFEDSTSILKSSPVFEFINVVDFCF